MQKISPFLWFDSQAEEAAKFYTSFFDNSKIRRTVRYGESGPGPKGTVMTVSFQLEGQEFVALNGGPQFTFTPAIPRDARTPTSGGLITVPAASTFSPLAISSPALRI